MKVVSLENLPNGILCEQMDGQSIWVKVNKNNLIEARELDINSVVTVKYSGYNSNNKLIHPIFYRKRYHTFIGLFFC